MSDNSGDKPPKPPKQRRASRRRQEIPAALEQVEAARKLAVKRARLEAQLEKVSRARLQAVVDLRAAGVTQGEIAELLDVTKGRIQQMEKEAAEAGLVPTEQLEDG